MKSIVDIKILVATHKKYWMPNDVVYLPIHVGREGKEDIGYIGDNTGDNISTKNANYCELTGLYWAWQNLKCDYIGLCHYRRYFCKESFILKFFVYSFNRFKTTIILNKKCYENLLSKYQIILPKRYKLHNIDVYMQYKLNHNIDNLDKCLKIIDRIYPEYVESYKKVMKQDEMYLYNMFVMPKSVFDDYMRFLFAIFTELEKNIDISNYDPYQSRVYGFLSERLFNVWLEKNKFKIKEMPVLNLETMSLKTALKNRLRRIMNI